MMADPAKDYIERPRPVTPPKKPLPQGAWDTHAHVFGPYDRYPLMPGRPYQPPLSPHPDYIAMLDTVGFDQGVLVHASANGWDNRTTSDAVSKSWPRLRGISVLPVDVSDEELVRLDEAGIRGVRITDHNRGAGPGVLSLKDMKAFASRFRDLNWHFQVWTLPSLAIEHFQDMKDLGVPVIFDHMAACDVGKGVDSTEFQTFLTLMKESEFWIKLTPGRVSDQYPGFDNVRPFHDAYLEAFPDRLVFGSDWPFIGNDETLPDVGRMVDLFDQWTSDEAIRQQVFVTNPSRFYGG